MHNLSNYLLYEQAFITHVSDLQFDSRGDQDLRDLIWHSEFKIEVFFCFATSRHIKGWR